VDLEAAQAILEVYVGMDEEVKEAGVLYLEVATQCSDAPGGFDSGATTFNSLACPRLNLTNKFFSVFWQNFLFSVISKIFFKLCFMKYLQKKIAKICQLAGIATPKICEEIFLTYRKNLTV
jgi:hypothetical protein